MKEGVWLISILLKMKFARSWYVELYTRNSKRAPHFSKLMLCKKENTLRWRKKLKRNVKNFPKKFPDKDKES